MRITRTRPSTPAPAVAEDPYLRGIMARTRRIPAPAPAPEAEVVAIVKPPKVLRGAAVRRPPVGEAAPDFVAMRERAKADIAAKLKSISEAYAEIDAATARIDAMSKVVEARLRSVNMSEYSDGVLRAAIEDVYSRQSTYIDPKKFRAAVEADAFWGSIKVIIDEASKHLGKNELARLSDITPGKKTGTRFVVKPVTKKSKE